MGRVSSMWVDDRFNVNMAPINEDKYNEFIVTDGDVSNLKAGRSLLTKLAASHWGYVNKNAFWYDPSTVDNTIETWTKPFAKPVLTYHPKAQDTAIDPVGRIIGAKYVLGVARAFIEDELIPNNVPHGHLEFLSRISDPVAIPKVLDRRYDTVSISAVASNVLCSICGEKVAIRDSKCEHQRFRRYNKDGEGDKSGDVCYYRAGPLLGRHVAFVISPSDIYAGVKSAEWEGEIADASAQDLLMELFVLSDTDKVLLNLHGDTSDNLFDMLDTEEEKSTIFDILNADHEPHTDSVDGHNNDNGKEDSNSMDYDELITMTDEEIDAKLKEDPEFLTEDAKLTYAARKALPDSAFCGPKRSYPAHDAAHVRNGLARLNQSKGKPRGKILSCLRARASKYGIKVATKVKKDEADELILEELTIIDTTLADATIDDILALDIVEAYIKENYTANSDDSGNADTGTDDTNDDTGKSDTDAEIEKLRVTIKEREDEITALTANKAKLHGDHKASLVDRIIDLKLWTRAIDADSADEARTELMERTMDSLADTLSDLRSGVTTLIQPGAQVESKQIKGGRDPDDVNSSGAKMGPREAKFVKYGLSG